MYSNLFIITNQKPSILPSHYYRWWWWWWDTWSFRQWWWQWWDSRWSRQRWWRGWDSRRWWRWFFERRIVMICVVNKFYNVEYELVECFQCCASKERLYTNARMSLRNKIYTLPCKLFSLDWFSTQRRFEFRIHVA